MINGHRLKLWTEMKSNMHDIWHNAVLPRTSGIGPRYWSLRSNLSENDGNPARDISHLYKLVEMNKSRWRMILEFFFFSNIAYQLWYVWCVCKEYMIQFRYSQFIYTWGNCHSLNLTLSISQRFFIWQKIQFFTEITY